MNVLQQYDGAGVYAIVRCAAYTASYGGIIECDEFGVWLHASEEGDGTLDVYPADRLFSDRPQKLRHTRSMFFPWQAGPIIVHPGATDWPPEVPQ